MQVIYLLRKKIELTPNLKGLKRIEYDSDDLSFDAAMDLEKKLADFKKSRVRVLKSCVNRSLTISKRRTNSLTANVT